MQKFVAFAVGLDVGEDPLFGLLLMSVMEERFVNGSKEENRVSGVVPVACENVTQTSLSFFLNLAYSSALFLSASIR